MTLDKQDPPLCLLHPRGHFDWISAGAVYLVKEPPIFFVQGEVEGNKLPLFCTLQRSRDPDRKLCKHHQVPDGHLPQSALRLRLPLAPN
jgi:hypothetical protein